MTTDTKSGTGIDNDLRVVIEPKRGLFQLDLGEMWRYRELFGFLAWRDVKIRYKQTLLGFGWAILGPLLTALIFSVLFGKVGNMPDDGIPKPVFYMAGLVIWRFFATGLTQISNSMVGNQTLFTKVYLPRIIIPSSTMLSGLIDLAIGTVCLLLIMLLFEVNGQRIVPPATALMIPLLVLIAAGAALGVGLILTALNVKYRDVKEIIPLLVQLWMYCTVIIPFSKIPERLGVWRYLYGLNPMAGVVEGFRWCLLHPYMSQTKDVYHEVAYSELPGLVASGALIDSTVTGGQTVWRVVERVAAEPASPWPLVAIGAVVSLGLLGAGIVYFQHTERQFADIV